MRIRTIKPEFWRSDDITRLTREERLLFIGLWSYVDDNGVGIDDYRSIAADLFALEDDQKEIRDYVRETLATLSRALLIDRYEVEGRCYIHISKWKKHQRVDRPNRARYPEPPPDHKPPTSEDVESSRDPRDTLATVSPPGTEEQGNRGTGDRKNTRAPRSTREPSTPDGFDEFWAAYPRKEGKRAAVKAYAAALKRGAEPAQMLTAVRRYAAVVAAGDPRFTAHPTTWLNQGRYDDEPVAPSTGLAVGSFRTQSAHPSGGTTNERVNAILALKRGTN